MRLVGLTDERCVRELRILRSMPLAAKIQCCAVLLSPVLFTFSLGYPQSIGSKILHVALTFTFWLYVVLFLATYSRGFVAEKLGTLPAPPPESTSDPSIWKIPVVLFAILLALEGIVEGYVRIFHPRWGGGGDLQSLSFSAGMFLFVLSNYTRARFALDLTDDYPASLSATHRD